MKKIMIFVLCLASISTKGQSSLDIGLNYAPFAWNTVQGSTRFSSYDNFLTGKGFFSNLSFELYADFNPNYVKNEYWTFTSGIFFHRKKAKMKNEFSFSENIIPFPFEDLRFNYLEVPLMVNYRIHLFDNPDFLSDEGYSLFNNLYLSAGGYVAYAVSGKGYFKNGDGNNQQVNLFNADYKSIFNRHDAGLRFSVALGLSSGRVGISFDYEYGLIDIIKNNPGKKATNNTFLITAKFGYILEAIRF